MIDVKTFLDTTGKNIEVIEDENAKELFKTIFQEAAISMDLVSIEGKLIKCNKAFVEIIGYTEDELIKMHFEELTYPEDIELDLKLFNELMCGKRTSYKLEKRYVTKSGNIIWGKLTASLIWGKNNEPLYAIRMLEDITAWKSSQEDLKRTQVIMSNILGSITDCFISIDKNWNIVYANTHAGFIFGKDFKELIGTNILQQYGHLLNTDSLIYKSISNAMESKESLEFEQYFDNCGKWFSIHAYPSDCIISFYFRDITESKIMHERLKEQTHLDGLTGINNRRCFDEYIEEEWGKNCRNSSSLSVIMVDVDDFKAFNDTYGHLGGDRCLKEVAETLKKALKRESDCVTRFGGEEFAVVLPRTSEKGAKLVAERLRKAIEALRIPHNKSRTSHFVTISLGVATMIPTIYSSSNILIEKADRALYQAKALGRNKVLVYSTV